MGNEFLRYYSERLKLVVMLACPASFLKKDAEQVGMTENVTLFIAFVLITK